MLRKLRMKINFLNTIGSELVAVEKMIWLNLTNTVWILQGAQKPHQQIAHWISQKR